MPMARTRRGRLRQIANWLRDEFPTPYPVDLKFTKVRDRVDAEGESCTGETYRRGRRVVIELDSRLRWMPAIEVLLHEWAHAMVYRHHHVERLRDDAPHDEEWAIAYGKVYRAFHDRDGWRDSRKYPQ